VNYDYVVIGAGLAGAVIAERIARVLKKNVMIIEKRNHIGGNCYDEHDAHGILIHKYGPHLFHTDSKRAWQYLSSFTKWHTYHHRVLVNINGKNVPLPVNFTSLRQLFDKGKAAVFEKFLIDEYGADQKIPVLELKNSRHRELHTLADFIIKNIYMNYSQKQWGASFDSLGKTVTERVPIFTGTDVCYFLDRYQGLPEHGYTALIEKMIDNSRIKILLNTDYREVLSFDDTSGELELCGCKFNGILINTGKIDEFLNYKFGELPYRSMKLHFETYPVTFYQENSVINYPGALKLNRITEFKHLTGQKIDCTTIAREYPEDHHKNFNDPYYPIPHRTYLDLYEKYKNGFKGFDNIIMLGRLGEYRYYDMDQVVLRALDVFEEIKHNAG
jgi:UDP-galactopyranose mutase